MLDLNRLISSYNYPFSIKFHHQKNILLIEVNVLSMIKIHVSTGIRLHMYMKHDGIVDDDLMHSI